MAIAKTQPHSHSGFPEPLYPFLDQNNLHLRNGKHAGHFLPTHKELPETDGKPVENMYEHPQSMLLTSIIKPVLDRKHPDGNYVMAADSGIYWMAAKEPLEGCKSPDWYYVPGVPRLLDGEFRRSYVMWREKVSPFLVCEYVSGTGAEEHDATPGWGKFWVYEREIKADYYVIWDALRNRLEVFELGRSRYRALIADGKGRFAIRDLGIKLGVWEGSYLGADSRWLRAWDSRGRLLPTAEETAALEKQRAETEKHRADRFAAKLRELGIDPGSI